MTWIDKLLDNVRTLFTGLYGAQLKKEHTSIVDCPFDPYFDRKMQELEPAIDGSASVPFKSTSNVDLTPPSSSGTDHAADEPPPMPVLLKGASSVTFKLEDYD